MPIFALTSELLCAVAQATEFPCLSIAATLLEESFAPWTEKLIPRTGRHLAGNPRRRERLTTWSQLLLHEGTEAIEPNPSQTPGK